MEKIFNQIGIHCNYFLNQKKISNKKLNKKSPPILQYNENEKGGFI